MIKRCVWTEPDDGAGRLSQNWSDTRPLRTGTTRIITHMRLALPLPTLPHLFPPPLFFYVIISILLSRHFLPFSYFTSALCLGLEDGLLRK